jgi:uridylate kinase
MPSVADTYTARAARAALDDGYVIVLGGGTGNPFFTTDTAAALRASEMGCEALLKGTKVDGVYSADPKLHPDAIHFPRMTHHDVLSRDLKVMDAAAISLARENRIPIIVFSIHKPGNFARVMLGEGMHTIIGDAPARAVNA